MITFNKKTNMKRTPILTLVAGAALLFASCKGKNATGLEIPKDAAVVFHINPKSLSSKLSWDDIKKTEWFKDAYAESKDSFAQKMMNDPQASGIDVGADMAFFLAKKGTGGYSVFEGSVKDEAAFAALIKKVDASAKTEKDGDWNVVSANGAVTLWNGEKFAVVNNAPLGAMNPVGGAGSTASISADSLKLFAKQTLNGDGESLFDDDRFASVMKDDADMHFWVNSGVLYSDMAGMFSMMKASALFQDNVMGGAINFEDGKIATRFKQFYGKEMQKAMDKWKFKDLDPAVLNRIPSDNVIGVFAMNLDPAGIKEIFKAMGLDGMANMFLSKQGLSFDEVLGATKGQLVMAVTDLQMKDTTITYGGTDGEPASSYNTTQPDMSFLFAADVAQKPTFDKLMNLAKSEMPVLPFTYQLNNDWFVAGNKPAAVTAFAAGNTTKHAFTDKLKGHYSGFYLDVQRLLKTNFTKDAFGQSLLTESAAVWQDVVMIADEYKDGVATGEMTINLVDGKTNALKQMNQYAEKMNALRKANEKKVATQGNTQDLPIDSMTTVVPEAPPVAEPRQ